MSEDTSRKWRIRKGILESKDFFEGKVMDFAISVMNLRADKLCAPHNRRVGVFGPYPDSGRTVILQVAEIISNQGCGVVTGLGFLEPNKPKELHKIDELLLPLARRALDYFEVPDFIKFFHFPRVTCKSVHHLTFVRGQGNEAAGCFNWDIPMMGFIIDEQVKTLKSASRLCNYLMPRPFYWECFAPGKGFCFHPNVKPTCPFYDYVNIPWDIKQLFMYPMNRLIACESLDNVKYSLIECLKAKPSKPTA